MLVNNHEIEALNPILKCNGLGHWINVLFSIG